MKNVELILRYSGFNVVLIAYNTMTPRYWFPGKGDYERNLFCTYMYRGGIREYRADNTGLSGEFKAELFLNISVDLKYPTYERMEPDTTWLCFSSFKPYTAEFLRLRGKSVIPAGIGAFCVLGSFEGDDVTAHALNYMKPRDRDVEVTGDAKIVLVKHGQFVQSTI